MYDYLFVTHLPAFYKVNLYNELATRLRIFVVFVAASSNIRTTDFVSERCNFDHTILFSGDFESRPKLYCLTKLLFILFRKKFHMVAVGGWDLPEFWLAVITCKKSRNAVVVESIVSETSTGALRLLAKKKFVSLTSIAFPSGGLHQQLLTFLGFIGTSYQTGGVGLFPRKSYATIPREFSASFLFVGRLSKEKNLQFLVEVFNSLPLLKLTIVGSGPMAEELALIAHNNITFVAHVPNQDICEMYLAHDIFILPSTREAWGLVVDEALHYGLPVIVSRNVGCHTVLVSEGVTGFTFDPHDKQSLVNVLSRASDPECYYKMKKSVQEIDFSLRDGDQLMSYVEASLASSRRELEES